MIQQTIPFSDQSDARVRRDAAWHAEVRRQVVGGLADREAHSMPASIVGWALCLIIGSIIGLGPVLVAGLVLRVVSIGLTRWACVYLRRALAAGQPFERRFALAGTALALSGLSWGFLTWPILHSVLVDPAGLALLALVITGVCLICSMVGLSPPVLVGFASCFGISVLIGSFVMTGGSQPLLAAALLLPLIGAVPFGIGQRRQAIQAAEDAVDNLHLGDEIASALHHAEFLSRHDALTGLRNRRALFEEFGNGPPDDGSHAILALDLDFFKTINDRFGHKAGDDVLIAVADVMRAAIRNTASPLSGAYRLGGEEFLLVIHSGDASVGVAMAEQLRVTIAGLKPIAANPTLRVTASLGVIEWRSDTSLAFALGAVDRMLYAAKAAGRDCVRCARSDAIAA